MLVKAVMPVFYDYAEHSVGEEFEVSDDLHAKVLLASGRVIPVSAEEDTPSQKRDGHYRRRDMRADK